MIRRAVAAEPENAAYLDSLAWRYPTAQADRLGALIDGFGLQPHLDKPLYMLSTGSKRKVWLSAALAAGAPLTLIDQPLLKKPPDRRSTCARVSA
jgi:ABC-type transport system involved in cytochrome c biogenesis ATPase subunit